MSPYKDHHVLKKEMLMGNLAGVYPMTDSKGTPYFKASITCKGKHISLGSYQSEQLAHQAYLFASELLTDKNTYQIDHYPEACVLSHKKWVILINYRDNGFYFKTPIYLMKRYFIYYIDEHTLYKFDIEDLFFYAKHTISKRDGHLFVADYGMQLSLLSRYGIKSYAVLGRDYQFKNGDPTDFRYANIEVTNRFHGVQYQPHKNKPSYLVKIHLNGDYIVGRYQTEYEAAIAYNKATKILRDKGITKQFPENLIEELDEISYSSIYHKVRISKKIRDYVNTD